MNEGRFRALIRRGCVDPGHWANLHDPASMLALITSSSMGALDIAGVSIGSAMGVASGAMGVIGALSSAGSAAATAESAQKAALFNQQQATQNAQHASQVASANEDAQRRKSAYSLGAQRASLAENGISLTDGTGADLTGESSVNSEMDALNIRYGGTLQARGYSNEATMYGVQAQDAARQKRTALKSGPLNAGAAALSAYGNYAAAGSRMKLT